MKKTLTVNLNGRVFNIDEDAYHLLDKYLRNLRIYFRNEEGSAEILADFEARIEELLSERVRLGYNVISIENVEKVIAQVGRPDEFGTKEENDSAEPQSKTENFTSTKKKLYRNPDDRMISGLCSGVSAYFNIEVNLVRIIAVILIFLTSLWIVPAYLIAWIFVPEARTAEEKLEMEGKPITVENIGKTVAAGASELKKNTQGCLGSFLDFIAAFFKVGLVGLGCLIGLPLIFALVVVIIVLFATIFGVGTGILGSVFPWTDETFLFVSYPALATVAFCLIIGIPLVTLVYTIVAHLLKLKPVHKSVKWVGLITWIVAIILFAFSGFKVNWSELPNKNWQTENWTIGFNISAIHGNSILADREEEMPLINEFKINGNLDILLQVEESTDGKTHLLINGESNIIDKINIHQEGNSLTLRNEKRYNLKPTSPILVRLQTSQLRDIDVSGASKVNVSGTFNANELEIDVSGAGKLIINDLHINKLDVETSGASEIILGGTVKNADLEASGASKILALELVSDTVLAKSSGASLIKCNPIEHFNGEATGAANIKYKQMPQNGKSQSFGVGKITQE